MLLSARVRVSRSHSSARLGFAAERSVRVRVGVGGITGVTIRDAHHPHACVRPGPIPVLVLV